MTDRRTHDNHDKEPTLNSQLGGRPKNLTHFVDAKTAKMVLVR